jgi:hypothetical protein
MQTIGELIDELSRFPRSARVSVSVDLKTANKVRLAYEENFLFFAVDIIQPIGCNQNDVQIRLGGEQ